MRLTIERMAYGADAIAHDDAGKTVFVPGGAPGDVVEAAITSSGSSYDHARISSVIEAGQSRVAPACPLAGTCGGCPWAHLTRDAQLAAKRAAVVDALARIAHMDPDRADSLVATCEDPGRDWGYRNKVELAVAPVRGRVRVGMHAPSGGGIVKVGSCPLFDTRDAKLVQGVAGVLSYLVGRGDLGLTRVGIRSSTRTGDVEVGLWGRPGPFPRSQAAKVIADATQSSVTSVVRVLTKGPAKARRVVGVERLAGRGHWRERVGDETMRVSAPSFFQVNTAGAERLVELVLHALSPIASDSAMDLYSGAGTFTLPLARRAGWVDAVEAYGPAVRDLARNLDAAHLDNVDAVGGDAGREFPDTDASVIVVDPPRAGLSAEVVARLSAQGARAIAYVSCDPATLARDLARFAERGTFVPARITPVDLFPQTYHVETVTLLAHRSRLY